MFSGANGLMHACHQCKTGKVLEFSGLGKQYRVSLFLSLRAVLPDTGIPCLFSHSGPLTACVKKKPRKDGYSISRVVQHTCDLVSCYTWLRFSC